MPCSSNPRIIVCCRNLDLLPPMLYCSRLIPDMNRLNRLLFLAKAFQNDKKSCLKVDLKIDFPYAITSSCFCALSNLLSFELIKIIKGMSSVDLAQELFYTLMLIYYCF